MARGRMLNKTVSLSQKFANLPDDTCRLLATWSIAFLDYRGVFYAEPAIVRSQVMPLSDDITNAKIAVYLQAMEDVGLIARFEANDRKWMQWPGFGDNQIGLRRKRESTDFPAPPGWVDDDDANDVEHDGGNLPEESRDDGGNEAANIPPKGKEEKGKEVEVKGKRSEEEEDCESSDSPPAPDSPPSKPKSKKSIADERSSHPAILAVFHVTGKMPHKDIYEAIIDALGQSPNETKLKECWKAWRVRSYSPTNYAWATEWYLQGIPAQRSNYPARASPKTPAEKPREGIPRDEFLKARAASDARLAAQREQAKVEATQS